MSLSRLLEEICNELPTARMQQFAQNLLANKIRVDLKNELESYVNQYIQKSQTLNDYKVKASPGSGNWAEVVWAAVLDQEITNTAQRGFYPVYLFKPDGSGIYLSLNQGTTNTIETERVQFRDAARQVAEVADWGLQNIELGANTPAGASYEAPNIVARFYKTGSIPSDQDLAKDLFELLFLYQKVKENTLGERVIKEDSVVYKAKTKESLNQILYGPPGTGKTYSTIDFAVSILEPNSSTTRPGSIEALKQVYPGQVEFVTFHQSFSYEDFVEGIQAKTDGQNISYQVEDGVFKRICQTAKAGSRCNVDSVELLRNAIKQLAQEITDKGPIDLVTKARNKSYKLVYYGNQSFYAIPDSSVSEVENPVSFQSIEKWYLSALDENVDDTKIPFKSYTIPVLEYLKINYSVPDYVEKSESVIKPHILIIDEINRGNISRIFGELITLIEPSKRAGNDEAIEVTLPYSKEPFSVPNNLYIIGTMNTADRSLALMDTALRRRFDFIEMMPQPGMVVEDLDGVNVRKMLEVMNQRIEALYDREHTLGHAFLMKLNSFDDLRNAFKNKILPLLEEYFYDDWQKIRWVLGAAADHFYQKQAFNNLFSDSEAPNDTEKFQRQTLGALTAEQFQAIYQGV